jgi:FkbM family methyltransferase
MPSGWRGRISSRLDRPGTRWLLAVLGSLWITVALRAPCFVRWKDGAWIHHYRGNAIPHWRLLSASYVRDFVANPPDYILYEYAPRTGDVVVDVGAGLGSTTLVLSRLVGPEGRVVALEAHPRTHGWLQRLCTINGLANVTALQVAASAVDGELVITDSEWQSNSVLAGGGGGVMVPARSLDNLVQELGIARVNLLTMNIEGAERLAIEGMTWLIDRTDHVCIACHDFAADAGASDGMRTKALIRTFLIDQGFRVTTRDDRREPWVRDYVYGVNARTG